MSEWREVTLGDVATISWGDTSTTKAAYAKSGFPAYSATGQDGLLPYADHTEDGVVISAIGAQCGKTWYAAGSWSCIKNTLWMRGKPGLDTRFLFYATSRQDLWPRRGAAQPFIGLGDAKAMRLRIPDDVTQVAIGTVLGSMDKLIENNRRRVEVLEEMARAIYREWFVKFRYPGHEDVPLVDSPLGRIPEGWVVSRLGAIVDFTMGQSPKSEFYNVQGNGLPFHQGVADFGRHFPTTRKWCSVQGRSALAGDVLVSVRAPVGRINVADTEMTIGRGLAALRAKDGRQALLLERLRETFEVEDSLGNDGAIFKSLGRAEFVSIPVLVPTDAVADAANAILTDNLGSIRALSHSIQRLTELRDLLLPKLVTGQIDVSTLDLDALISSTSSQKEMAS